jgi:6-phosphogluconolactonase (cycloisomerase 2 family)
LVDTTPPTIACPATITAECTGNGAARVNPGQATASDACGPVTFVNQPAVGDYPLGTTEAATAVKDAGNNTSTCTQKIVVVDTTPPTITCPAPITVECTSGKARVNPGRATATDTCSAVAVTNAPQGDYPLGATQATYSAKDQAGNVSSCAQTVTVQDTRPPVVTSGQDGAPAKTIPVGAEFVTIDLLADCQLAIADACDGAITPTAANTSAGCVTVNEGPARAVGPDVVFVDATHVKVWPKSLGGGAGRLYRIPVTVKDSSGNTGTATCRIAVGPGLAGADPGTEAQTLCPGQEAQACTLQTCSAYVYAAGGAGGVHGYALDAGTGALTEFSSSPFPISSLRVAAHPSLGFLYVTNSDNNSVGAYAVAHDGSLSLAGQAQQTGAFPEAVTVNPAGTFVYVGNVYGGGTGIYPIDPATGGLGAGVALDSGSYNHGGVFDPTGKWFYLSRNNSNDVTRYLADGATGALTSGVVLQAAGGYHEAMDPQGRYLYVSDWDKSGGDKLSAYAIGADGTVTLVGNYTTGGVNPAGVAVTPDGRFVYTVNWGSGTIAGYSVGSGGALTALTGSPFALGDGAWELSLDPSGKWLFAGHGAVMSTFTIDGTSGALTPLGKPLTANGSSPAVGASVVVLVR